jgi:armadillo repeat-containing protein 8
VILSNIIPSENHPQVVLTALRALNNIAEATDLTSPDSDDADALSETLFVPRYLEALCAILASDSTATVIQEQKYVVAGLVSRLCKGTQQQNALANAGILDGLATMLASFVVARGEVVPGAEIWAQSEGLAEMIPDAASRGANLAIVLEAISAIIADSRYRTCILISSPSILAVFPYSEFSPPVRENRTAWTALEMCGLSSLRSKNPGAMDYLLPIVPVSQHKPLSSQFAQFPLGYSMSRENLASNGRSTALFKFSWDPNRSDSASSNGDGMGDEPESPLIPWLIHLVRTSEGLERVMAASVVASLFKAGFANPEREVALGITVVPILCNLIKEHDKEWGTSQESAFVSPETALNWAIAERTPAVLGRLIADSEYLQRAAYECGIMKVACKLLKDSYEPLPAQSAPRPWSPTPDRGFDRSDGVATCRVGPPGPLPVYTHKIKLRESALKLIAAMITSKDEYRKALVEQEVVPYIVESLSASPSKPKISKEKSCAEREADDQGQPNANSPYGNNPISVIIAACHVLRVLGRSVSNLRTSLEDHGVAIPVFRLLKHPDAEVQIAACGVVINLVLEFSPMREVSGCFRCVWVAFLADIDGLSSLSWKQECSRCSASMRIR